MESKRLSNVGIRAGLRVIYDALQSGELSREQHDALLEKCFSTEQFIYLVLKLLRKSNV